MTFTRRIRYCYDSKYRKYRLLEITREKAVIMPIDARSIYITLNRNEFDEEYFHEEPLIFLTN